MILSASKPKAQNTKRKIPIESEATESANSAVKPADENLKAENGDLEKKTQRTTHKAHIDEEHAESGPEAESSNGSSEAGSKPDPLEVIQNELAAERDKYLRLAAEYDNYRKRSAKEREMTYSSARADAITKLLPVYDNLERALRMECADEAYYKGVEMIMVQLTEIFEDIGVKQIPAVGEPFDPNRHNAVLTIEDPELGENTVAEEYQKGFILGERVIRFSTVVVAN